MTTKLAVTVAVDMDATAVTLKPAGTLTRDNVRGLIAVAHRARRVLADFTVHADLDRVHAVVPEALQDLADAGVETLVPHRGNALRESWRPRPAARPAARPAPARGRAALYPLHPEGGRQCLPKTS